MSRRHPIKTAVEHQTSSLRLPVRLVQAVEGLQTQASRALGPRPPRARLAAVPTCLPITVAPGRARRAPPASSCNTPVFTSARSTSQGGPSLFPRE
jgi:hypothetical protein